MIAKTAMNKTEDIMLEQEHSMRLNLMLTLVGLIPFILVSSYSGSMLLWTDTMDYVRALIVNFVAWRILGSVRKGSFLGFDYGTDKVQSLVGIGGSLFYLLVLVSLGASCIYRLFRPLELEAGVSLFGVLLQFVSISADVYFWRKNKRLSRELFSPVLEMQWRTERASAIITFAMATGLFFSVLLLEHSWAVYIDPICALVFIAYGTISFLPSIARELECLTDKTLKEELQLRIDRHLAENFSGYSEFHGVRSRSSGGRVFIEISLSFPHEMLVSEVMKTVNALERGIVSDIPGSEVSVSIYEPKESIDAQEKSEK
jgi:divalent metal cation (Fe/Co/Zn/Cd) transporter